MRRAMIACLLAFVSATAVADVPDLGLRLERVARRTTVRIYIRPLDYNQQGLLTPPDVGHGVIVSEDGWIATAAHVLVPKEGWETRAVSYNVEIYEWNEDKLAWNETPQKIHSSVLPQLLVTSKPFERTCQPVQDQPPMPCYEGDPDLNDDYAFLRLPDKKKYPFVDIVGPKDQVTRFQAQKFQWLVFVQSEFHPRRTRSCCRTATLSRQT